MAILFFGLSAEGGDPLSGDLLFDSLKPWGKPECVLGCGRWCDLRRQAGGELVIKGKNGLEEWVRKLQQGIGRRGYSKGRACLALLAVGLLSVVAQRAHAEGVTWEQQAERLQNVSAALLDGVPFSFVMPGGFYVSAGGAFSLLPEVNPRVGGKTEQVPSSPVHGIPTLQLSYGLDLTAARVGTRLWAGYLPPGAEGLFGVEAELNQWSVGGAVSAGFAFPLPPLIGAPAIELGWQRSVASVRGAITEKHAHDKFDTETQIFFLSLGLHPSTIGLHAAVLFGMKETQSTFEIPSDSTKLALTDTLSDTAFPLLSQVQLGWRMPPGITVGLAELWVPERLAMPRVFVQLDYEIL